MRGINWGAADWMSEDKFQHRFNASRKIEIEDKTTGEMKMIVDERSGRHAELQNRLRANLMTRHLKREVMPQLKMPIYDLIQVEETRAVKQALFAESLLNIDPDFLEGSDMTVLGPVATARKIMGLAIAPQVADYVKMLILGGETKIVLFAWHIEVMDILEAALVGLGTVRIDGRHTAKQKEALKQLFIQDEHRQVMLGNLLSLGTGTDGLQYVSNHALIAEPSWTPGENVQAFDRLDRGGQTRVVQGEIFVAPGSISEKILAKALRKLAVTHNSLDARHMSMLGEAVK
jgi:SNF2 family DNA or RNA helicase